MHIFDPFLKFFERYKKFMISAQQFVLLHIVYVIGIGLTAIVAKIFGKHFVLNKVTQSSWVTHSNKGDSSRMF